MAVASMATLRHQLAGMTKQKLLLEGCEPMEIYMSQREIDPVVLQRQM